MANIIIKHDPLSSHKEIVPVEAGTGLVEKISSIYKKGFQTETKVYVDSPHKNNEIDLKSLTEDIKLGEDDIYWICHFPQGLELLIIAAVAGAVAYKGYTELAENDAKIKAEEAVAAAQAAADAASVEIPDETNLDVSTIGRGTSSNNVITAQSNQVRLGQKIPLTYGYTRSFSDVIGDPYNEFSAVLGSVGDQTLFQYFGVSSNFLSISDISYPDIARIGNQALSTDDTITLSNKSQTLPLYNDYIEHLNDVEDLILSQNLFSGDYDAYTWSGAFRSIVISISGGSGTISFNVLDSLAVGQSGDAYRIYKAFTQSDFSVGDQFQMFSNTGGLSGVFDLIGFEMIDNGTNSESCVLTVSNASGFTNNTYNSDTIGLASVDGRYAGNSLRTDSNLPFPTTVAASGLQTLLLSKRAQKVAVNTADFITVNVVMPSGKEVSGAFNNLTRFVLQPIEVDNQGTKLGDIGLPIQVDVFPPTDRNIFTLKVPVPQVDGRLLGVEITRTDVQGGLAYGNGNSSVIVNTRSQIISAGHLVERTNYANSLVSIISLIRTAPRVSQKKATGNFNIKVLSGIPLFDFVTGTFGALAFSEAATSWHQIFMNHAVNVGRIPFDQIDYEQLEAIDQDIRLENGNTTSAFNFTFSNKSSMLDEELSLICSSVRVNMYKDGSTYKFSRDQVKPKVGNITSRNCSFQSNLKAVAFSLPNPEDGLELEFINGETDKAEIIYVPENRLALRPKRMFLSGVTDYTRAWRRAQYEYLLLFNRRVTRSVLTTKEAVLWDLIDRVTVYDHTRLSIVPYESNLGGWRQETEVKEVDGTVIIGSEKLLTDSSISFTSMAMELNLDLPDGTGLGVVQNVLINIDPDDTRRFSMDPSVDPTLAANILAQIRIVSANGQIGERIFVYPVDVTDKQLAYDDYLINTKTPEGEQIRLELVRYNPDVYQFDDQNPPS